MLVPACDGFLFLSSESLTETQCSQLQIKDELAEKGSNQMREQSLEPSRPQDYMLTWCVIYQHWLGKLCTLLESVTEKSKNTKTLCSSSNALRSKTKLCLKRLLPSVTLTKRSQISTNQSSSFLFLRGKIFHYMYRLKAHVQTHTV